MSTFKSISIATILAGLLVGCGGGSSSSSSTTLNKATLIDDFVAGVKYVNGTNEGFTDSNGQFPYDSGSVEFYIGDIRLGTLSSVPVDNKIFIQDLVGVSRTDTTNSEVIKIGRFLQSLDSDKSTDKIEITRTDFDKFEDTNDTKSNLNDNSVIVDTLLSNVGFANKDIVSAAKAQSHIENILEFHGEKTTSIILSLTSSNINDGDTNINEDTDIELTFNDDIPRKYLTSDYFILTNDSTNARVNTTITRDQNVVTITPNSDLDNSENYTLTIKNTIKSYAGTDINLGGNTDKTIGFATQSSANLPPVANAGIDQIVTQGTSVTLDAGASSDSDGTISSYSWAEGSTILSTNSSFNKSDFSVGTHNITLTVTDDDGATSTDDVTITVNQSSNVIPVANAGADQTVTEGSTVTLDGSASTDSDGTIVSYQWMEGSTLLSSNASFTKSDFSVGTHTLALTVTDNNNGVHTDTVNITVNAASSGGNTGGNNPDAFIIKINTDLDTVNTNKSFYIDNRGTADALNIDCDNDGTYEFIASTPQANYTCNYPTSGVYEVAITSTDPEVFIDFNVGTDGAHTNQSQITELVNWGDIKWNSMSGFFNGAKNLSAINANAGNPDLSNVTSTYLMFGKASSFNVDISSWDVSNVQDFNSMFSGATIFNQNIGNWDVSNATSLAGMFNGATAFNQDISSWNVSKVTNMSSMFRSARAFNQDISSWDVSKVVTMSSMFDGAFAFNQDISSWDVSKVTTMANMFNSARAFNQNIGNWDVSSVTNMSAMFNWATVFNQDISSWDVSNVTNMYRLFSRASAFNQDIGAWNVSSATTMGEMFSFMTFNQDIGSWNVSNVTNMAGMFSYNGMFNQDISSWQIQNVENMSEMFKYNGRINQDFSAWYPRKNANLVTTDIFLGANSMTQANKDAFLVGPVVAPLNAVITAQGISGTPFCSPSQRVGSEFITFTGNSSTGNIVSYSWTDVTAGNSNNFIDGGTTVSETYSCVGLPAGTRTIRLTIEDSSGNTDTQDQTLNVIY